MKKVTVNISDETYEQVRQLAMAHHPTSDGEGNRSAMMREILDKAIMPHDYYPKRDALEARFTRKDEEQVCSL